MTLRTLARLAASATPAGIRVPILSGPLRGSWWYSGAAAGAGKGLAPVLNLSEPARFVRAHELCKGKNVCFDIGANVGLYSLLFARNAKQVFAFEPLLRNVVWLHRVLNANRATNVTVIPCAVSDRTTVAMFEPGQNCAEGKLSSVGQPILCVSIDDFVERFQVVADLLKIDVEGAELAVLSGAKETLSKYHPAILLSTHSPELQTACTDYLSRIGYSTPTLVDSDGSELTEEFIRNGRP